MVPQPSVKDAQRQISKERVGLLTKTLMPSPTIRRILPARIRSLWQDDYVCIGRDFIQLFEIESDGRINHVATKSDFGGEIGAANVIGYFDPYDFEKAEDSQTNGCSNSSDAPSEPQILTFTLVGIGKLFFLTASQTDDGEVLFQVSSIHMPRFSRQPRLLGNALAIDPRSRALAVAASESSVFVCHADHKDLSSSGQQRWDPGFSPMSRPQVLSVSGNILLMDFLFPPNNDPDRVILLMIVLRGRNVHPVCFNWSHAGEICPAKVKPGARIFSTGEIPNLLIPLKSKNATFVLTTQRAGGFWICENILSGSLRTVRQYIDEPHPPAGYPPSSFNPLWACWVRPRRTDHQQQSEDYARLDFIYMIREDGNVQYHTFDQDEPTEGFGSDFVGSLMCHVDSAFASFGKSNRNDILIVHGTSSKGIVWMIGCRQAPTSDSEPRGGVHGFVITTLPNWSDNMDLVAKSASRKRQLPHSRDTLIAPSGRQPYGHITALRMGFNARIAYKEEDNSLFGTVSHAWILPSTEKDLFLLLLSSPGQTRVLTLSQPPVSQPPIDEDDFSRDPVIEVLGCDMQEPTLAAAALHSDCNLQITESGMVCRRNIQDSLLVQAWPAGSKAVAAAIEAQDCFVVVVLRVSGQSEIRLVEVNVDDEAVSGSVFCKPVHIEAEVISVAIHRVKACMFVVAGTSDGTLYILRVSPRTGLELHHKLKIPANLEDAEALNACEDILIISDETGEADSLDFVALCGMRGGSIYALEIQGHSGAPLSIISERHFTLGLTTVKLRSGKNGLSAFAACGDGFFSINLATAKLDAINISDVYLSELGAPERPFQQESVTAFCMVPNVDESPLSKALVVISNNHCYVTGVSDGRDIVPNNINVQGSPRTLLDSRLLNCFVSVSSHSRLRSPTTRAVKDMIQFTSSTWKCAYEFDYGLEVHSITEWVYRRTPESAPHVFIAVGVGRHLSRDETAHHVAVRGWVYLLQLDNNNSSVALSIKQPFEYPVTAVASYEGMGIVACSGTKVHLIEYDAGASKFVKTCNFVMHSPGIRVTTAPPHIHITTQHDSTLTLQLVDDHTAPRRRRLQNVARGNGARLSGSHTTIDVLHDDNTYSSLNLSSTLEGDLIGLRIPDPNRPPMIAENNILFTAKLPRSIVRIVEANVRPPWKHASAPGVLKDNLAYITIDGAISGLALLDEWLAYRLRYVQRLCERNGGACTTYTNGPTKGYGKQLPVILPPPGFDCFSAANGSMTQRPIRHLPEDMHVDGDILTRLVEGDGVRSLTLLLEREAAQANDALSMWIRDTLERHITLVPALIGEARAACDRWW